MPTYDEKQTLINAKIETGLPDSASQKDKDEAYMKALNKEVDKYASGVFMSLLDSTIGEENANKKLKKAGESRLSVDQAEIVSKIVDKHRGMADLGGDIATAVQEFNIAGETINMAINTATIAGGKLNIGQEIIARVIREDLQFALFALRFASDRNSLADYFLHTEAGRQMIEKTRAGFAKAGDGGLTKELDEAIAKQKTLGVSSLVDIISDSRGYEHTSELKSLEDDNVPTMAEILCFEVSDRAEGEELLQAFEQNIMDDRVILRAHNKETKLLVKKLFPEKKGAQIIKGEKITAQI